MPSRIAHESPMIEYPWLGGDAVSFIRYTKGVLRRGLSGALKPRDGTLRMHDRVGSGYPAVRRAE